MKRRINFPILAMGLVLTCCLLSYPAHAQQNVLKGCADPAIIQGSDEAYYVFATGRGLPFYKSTDLIRWERIGRIFETTVPDWARKEVPGTRGIWAPDITFYEGKYWLYYSVSTFGSQRSCIGLATNLTLNPDDPRYKWIDQGKVIESAPGKTNFNAIDPAAFTDQKGIRWLTWGSFWDGIKMTRLDPMTGKPFPDDKKIYSLACRPRHHAIEAAFVIFREGFYYLFVSFDNCCDGVDSTYKVMVGRSRAPTGPYMDIQGNPMENEGGSLVLASYDNWRGPGHNSILHTPKGDYIAHHTYDAREENGARNLQIRPLLWDQEGWPLVGEPVETLGKPKSSITKADLVGKWEHMLNFQSISMIELLSDGTIKDKTGARWIVQDGILELHWPDATAPGGVWIDHCTIAPDGQTYIGRNQTSMVIRGNRLS